MKDIFISYSNGQIQVKQTILDAILRMINVPRYRHLIVTSILVITLVNIYQNETLLNPMRVNIDQNETLQNPMRVNIDQNQTLQNPMKKLRKTSLFIPSKSKKLTKKPKKLKRILYWNASKKFHFCCGRGPYKKHKCPSSLCHISIDRHENLETFDAIIFHGRFLDPQDIPAIR